MLHRRLISLHFVLCNLGTLFLLAPQVTDLNIYICSYPQLQLNMDLNEQFLYNPHLVHYLLCHPFLFELLFFSCYDLLFLFQRNHSFLHSDSFLTVFLLNDFLRRALPLCFQDGVSSPCFCIFPLFMHSCTRQDLCKRSMYQQKVSTVTSLGTLSAWGKVDFPSQLPACRFDGAPISQSSFCFQIGLCLVNCHVTIWSSDTPN